MSRFGVILDSGYCVRDFDRKAQAMAFIRGYNERARASKEGDPLVSLRFAVGVARYKPGHPIRPIDPRKVKGGKARAAKLSPERRSEIAKTAALKRWRKA